MLQAHTDMVCAKEPWSTHDFLKDPIELVEENGWLHANGTTLAPMTRGRRQHPGHPGRAGALPPAAGVRLHRPGGGRHGRSKGLDCSLLQSRRMIGLDGIQEGTTIYSASAVRGCHFSASFPQADSPAGHGYRLTVTGLTSGHGAS